MASLRRHLVPEAAESELRAQIERALAASIVPTHIDAHMAAAMLPDLLEVHVRLANAHRLFPVLPRTIDWAPDPQAYQAMLARLDQAGRPIVDHCRGTLAVAPATLAADWRRMLATLPPGVTHVAVHCTAPGEFGAIAPDPAIWRQAEYDLVASGAIADLCAAAGVLIIGTATCSSSGFRQAEHVNGGRTRAVLSRWVPCPTVGAIVEWSTPMSTAAAERCG